MTLRLENLSVFCIGVGTYTENMLTTGHSYSLDMSAIDRNYMVQYGVCRPSLFENIQVSDDGIHERCNEEEM